MVVGAVAGGGTPAAKLLATFILMAVSWPKLAGDGRAGALARAVA